MAGGRGDATREVSIAGVYMAGVLSSFRGRRENVSVSDVNKPPGDRLLEFLISNNVVRRINRVGTDADSGGGSGGGVLGEEYMYKRRQQTSIDWVLESLLSYVTLLRRTGSDLKRVVVSGVKQGHTHLLFSQSLPVIL